MESKQDSVDSAVLPDDSGRAATAPARTRARGTIRTRLYRDGELIKENFPPDEISDELTQRHGCIIWLDLCEPNTEQLAIIGGEFGLHQLAIEDALEETQRTKIDRYQHPPVHGRLLGRPRRGRPASWSPRRSPPSSPTMPSSPCASTPAFDIDPVVARWDSSADLAQYGVSFLLYGLLDYLVDGHFRAVESLDQAIEETEDGLFDTRRDAIEQVQRRSFQLRKSLVLLRRITLPTREVVNTLLRHDLDIVPGAHGALLPGHLRPRHPGHGMDRVAAGSGHHHRGDQPDRAGQPDEPDHEEGDQLGGHHRRARPPSPAGTARTSPIPASARRRD